MLSVFEENLNFEPEANGTRETQETPEGGDGVYDDWLLERKIKTRRLDDCWDTEELGDSCCFGTRTVEFGMDRVSKVHRGV